MAQLVFAMSQSLDGYVASADGTLLPPGPKLFRYFTEFERGLAGVLYGRRMYEVMRYWDEDRADWTSAERGYAAAWRAHPKWVVSRSLKTAGPNATIVDGDVEAFVRDLKATIEGTIAVAGPELAAGLSQKSLVDRYDLYFRPMVLGAGKPYFARTPPPLAFLSSDRVGEDAVRLTYERAER